MRHRHSNRSALLALTAMSAAAFSTMTAACAQPERFGPRDNTIEVSGNGIHRFTTSIVHAQEPIPNGEIILSTDTIDLFGDLNGRLLYHPVTEIDFANWRLVNTGHQVFSGTVKGSDPVLLYDDEFRFEVDLMTGQVRGEVYLEQTLAGRRTRCELTVEGAGAPPGQDSAFTYEGTCSFRPRSDRAFPGASKPRAGHAR
jgi:hypothetical protein